MLGPSHALRSAAALLGSTIRANRGRIVLSAHSPARFDMDQPHVRIQEAKDDSAPVAGAYRSQQRPVRRNVDQSAFGSSDEWLCAPFRFRTAHVMISRTYFLAGHRQEETEKSSAATVLRSRETTSDMVVMRRPAYALRLSSRRELAIHPRADCLKRKPRRLSWRSSPAQLSGRPLQSGFQTALDSIEIVDHLRPPFPAMKARLENPTCRRGSSAAAIFRASFSGRNRNRGLVESSLVP